MPVGEYKRFKKEYKCSKCHRLFKEHIIKLGEYWYGKRNIYELQTTYCLCDSCYEKFERWINNERTHTD